MREYNRKDANIQSENDKIQKDMKTYIGAIIELILSQDKEKRRKRLQANTRAQIRGRLLKISIGIGVAVYNMATNSLGVGLIGKIGGSHATLFSQLTRYERILFLIGLSVIGVAFLCMVLRSAQGANIYHPAIFHGWVANKEQKRCLVDVLNQINRIKALCDSLDEESSDNELRDAEIMYLGLQGKIKKLVAQHSNHSLIQEIHDKMSKVKKPGEEAIPALTEEEEAFEKSRQKVGNVAGSIGAFLGNLNAWGVNSVIGASAFMVWASHIGATTLLNTVTGAGMMLLFMGLAGFSSYLWTRPAIRDNMKDLATFFYTLFRGKLGWKKNKPLREKVIANLVSFIIAMTAGIAVSILSFQFVSQIFSNAAIMPAVWLQNITFASIANTVSQVLPYVVFAFSLFSAVLLWVRVLSPFMLGVVEAFRKGGARRTQVMITFMSTLFAGLSFALGYGVASLVLFTTPVVSIMVGMASFVLGFLTIYTTSTLIQRASEMKASQRKHLGSRHWLRMFTKLMIVVASSSVGLVITTAVAPLGLPMTADIAIGVVTGVMFIAIFWTFGFKHIDKAITSVFKTTDVFKTTEQQMDALHVDRDDKNHDYVLDSEKGFPPHAPLRKVSSSVEKGNGTSTPNPVRETKT